MNQIDVKKIFNYLANREYKDGIFVSEADLQFQFGLAVKEIYKDKIKELIFEYPIIINEGGKFSYIDLVIIDNENNHIPIEFKYFTKEIKNEENSFSFLRNQNDTWRSFDYFKDLERIEKASKQLKNFKYGISIVLTNHSGYLKKPKKDANYYDFRLCDGREVEPREYKWADPNAKSVKNRLIHTPVLEGEYKFKWESYKKVSGSEFKYMANVYGDYVVKK